MSRRLLILLFLVLPFVGVGQVYKVKTGRIDFKSDAREELINASSEGLLGLLDAGNRTFAFRVGIASFSGFNSPLQREHFNENYMETSKYPYAFFTGKIIEDIDFGRDGEHTVRAKGKLTIHGVEQERIIYSKLIVKQGSITIYTDFVVALADHDIKIPRVVYEKLATNINVNLSASLSQK